MSPKVPASTRSSSPVVPAEVSLPEITIKAVLLSVLLAAVLAAANAYLGLFAGMTVSASIPAAVVSMAVLRLFRRSNILENNIVQTAASSGEAVAAGVIFTVPALLLIGHWQAFHYWQTTLIGTVGGVLGVLCTIPLRRVLIVETGLRYPEGLATAEVLKVGSKTHSLVSGQETARTPATGEAARGFRTLLAAAALGGVLKFAESGLRLWSDALEGAAQIGRAVIYGGINLSPALLAVGFILGPWTALVVFIGGALSTLVLTPMYGALFGLPDGLPTGAAAQMIWKTRIRYVGIGAMLIGGLWTLVQLRRPLMMGLKRPGAKGGSVISRLHFSHQSLDIRTERDAPLGWVVTLFLLTLIPMGLIYAGAVHDGAVGIAMTVIMAATAFLFSAVAGYMAGIVGSSSNPVSGVTIATIALSAVLLILMVGRADPSAPAAALLIGAVVCCAAAMGGDNLQDLKTGHLVGATPWKQQVMQVVGVLSGAVIIVPVLTLLQAKYGIGEITADHPHPLFAPQATLMASLVKGVFGGGLPWDMVGLGVAIGAAVILMDRYQEARARVFRLQVLGFALGMYLPLKLSAAILAGGLLGAFLQRASVKEDKLAQSRGLLAAAGLITGEALMGILLAVPVALSGIWPGMSPDPFMIFESPPWAGWPGLGAMAAIAVFLYRTGGR